MHPDLFARDPEPVFAWWADGDSFAIYDAEPIAQSLSAREQVRAAREALATAPTGSRLVGALPFDLSEPGALWIGTPAEMNILTDERSEVQPSFLTELAEDADREFNRFARGALKELEFGTLAKVVATRRFYVKSDSPFRPLDVFLRLCHDDAAAAFLCRSGDTTLVGASPETLAKKQGDEISSTPLAGSRSREVGDHRRASDVLLQSEKDLREHRLVVDQIMTVLRSAGVRNAEQTDPFVFGTDRIWHLATHITCLLDAGEERDCLHLVELLHPTPAVCGTPSDRAFDYIRQHETESRGLYSGAIGWQDQNGDGEWRVTLRCGVIDGVTALVTSGAGMVRGSDVEEELSETKHKAMTFIDAL